MTDTGKCVPVRPKGYQAGLQVHIYIYECPTMRYIVREVIKRSEKRRVNRYIPRVGGWPESSSSRGLHHKGVDKAFLV